MAPSVTFAFPSEILVPFQPTHIVIGFQPCGILIGKDIDGVIFTYFHNPYFIGVLGTVHLLDEQFVTARNEFHAGNVVVTCVTGKIQPSGVSTVGGYVAYFYSGVRSSGFRIGETLDFGINGIYIIDDIPGA